MNEAPTADRIQTPPPRQRPYDLALQMGFDELQKRDWNAERCAWLGVTMEADVIVLPVLGRTLRVDLQQRQVWVETDPARVTWGVLAVHYLSAENLVPDPREVSFSHFPDCRSYLSVFGKRITGRFLATSGRSSPGFAQAAEACGGTKWRGSGTGYTFFVFPRLPVTIIRYDGDDEIRPGASVIYRADAECLLPAEDRVIAAELLLDALAGKPMAESGGSK